MLEPLNKQFICDRCDEIINNPAEGYVEWRVDQEGHKAYHYKIVHQYTFSNLKESHEGCYFHTWPKADMPLSDFLGIEGMAELLSFLDGGKYHSPGKTHTKVADMREFVEFARRLTLPYYEEARLYLSQAVHNGFIGGANEVALYLPATLKSVIREYEDRGE